MVDVTVYLYAERNDSGERKLGTWNLNSKRDKKPVKEREGMTRKDIRSY